MTFITKDNILNCIYNEEQHPRVGQRLAAVLKYVTVTP